MFAYRFAGLTLAVLLCGCSDSDEASASSRQAQVAEAGAAVMPFDLERTTHVFRKVPEGGVQQVVSDDGDPGQIELIRDHLREEATRFASGDFHDPEMIHGEEMPGLHDLVTGHESLSIEYVDLPMGGQITYSTTEADLIAALHAWFDAQLSDHGAHARGSEPHP